MGLGFGGLASGLGGLALVTGARTRSISAENPTGDKGGGGMATEGTGAAAARGLGRGWKVSPSAMIAPGGTLVLADLAGPGAVQSMWYGGHVGRDLILRIHWDDQEQPAVECPLPDFFACGWSDSRAGATAGPFALLNSLPVVVGPNRALNCFWPMPFRRRCRMTLENRGPAVRTSYYQINYALDDVPEDAGYFHAQFRRTNPVPAGRCHCLLDGVTGQGQYVGTALCVGLNGQGNWWGEGEVKFYLDGDGEFPTICGTGTEDYFGGSYDWEVDGRYTPYSTPFLGMYQVLGTDGLYRSQQRFAMYRWHIVDPVRFARDIRVTIQDLGWRAGGRYLQRSDDFASVAYWYQTLPTAPFPMLPDPDGLEIL